MNSGFEYSHLYGIKATGLRFFTVYGPWGRPDMAVWQFTEAIIKEKPIQVYAEGRLLRDFTYIDDIISGITKILGKLDTPPPQVMNIGNNHPVTVNELVSVLEQVLEQKAIIVYLTMQPGDVEKTYADTNLINKFSGFKPKIKLKQGLEEFCSWYQIFAVQDFK